MEIKELGHIALIVSNLERSSWFYGQILGLKQIEYPFPLGMAFFTSGRTHHELVLVQSGQEVTQPEARPKLGVNHIAFKVGDTLAELQTAKNCLEQAGVILTSMLDVTYIQSISFPDPDGNEIELYVDNLAAPWQEGGDMNVMLMPKALSLN